MVLCFSHEGGKELIDLSKSARTGLHALKLCLGEHAFLVTADGFSVRKIVGWCVYIRCGTF